MVNLPENGKGVKFIEFFLKSVFFGWFNKIVRWPITWWASIYRGRKEKCVLVAKGGDAVFHPSTMQKGYHQWYRYPKGERRYMNSLSRSIDPSNVHTWTGLTLITWSELLERNIWKDIIRICLSQRGGLYIKCWITDYKATSCKYYTAKKPFSK